MAANILDGRFIVRPVWVELAEAVAIVALPLLLALVLPALRPGPSALVTLALWGALFAGAHAAFRQGLWVPLVYPSLALVVTFVAITIYRILTEELQRRWTKRAFQQYVSPEVVRSEEHTSELQSRLHLVCRLLLEKKKTNRCRHK